MSGRQILIVEDERIVAKDLQRTLAGFGYDVPATAASADEAIRIASDRCPDLVLMDIRIKGERDGIDTAELLRARFDVPVVYLTAYADDATLRRAKRTTPHGYLIKPVQSDELRTTIEVALYKHEMERRLRERERWYSTTLRSIGDAVIATDHTGAITYLNLMAELITGYRQDAVAGAKLADVLGLIDDHTGAPVENPISRALREGRVVTTPGPMRMTTNTGERPVEDTAAPIVDDRGNVLGAVFVFRDVTEQRKLQQQVMMSDRLASLGTLAAGVAHELNNPLTVVVASAGFFAEEVADLDKRVAAGEDPAELRDSLAALRGTVADLQDSATRMTQIVADLRTFSQPQFERRGAVAVRTAIEWAVRVTKASTRANVVIELGDVPDVVASEVRLGQILVNLITNAIDAMPDEPGRRNEIRITAEDESGRVVIAVADNGLGMSADVQRRIFEPFYTTKSVGRGSGLGLAVTHGIVGSLGGEIRVSSKPGAGARFDVVLPAAPRAESPDDESANPQIAEGRRARIVLIDDEAVLLKSLSRVLGRAHDVIAFSNPLEGLAYLRSRRDVDLVLCDVMMPELSGIDLYEQLLADAPDVAGKLVFLSGGAFTERGREFVASVTAPLLEKPFDPNELLVFVRDFLAARRQPGD